MPWSGHRRAWRRPNPAAEACVLVSVGALALACACESEPPQVHTVDSPPPSASEDPTDSPHATKTDEEASDQGGAQAPAPPPALRPPRIIDAQVVRWGRRGRRMAYELRWNEVAGARYRVQVTRGTGFDDLEVDERVRRTTFSRNRARAGVLYLRVQAIQEDRTSAFSEPFRLNAQRGRRQPRNARRRRRMERPRSAVASRAARNAPKASAERLTEEPLQPQPEQADDPSIPAPASTEQKLAPLADSVQWKSPSDGAYLIEAAVTLRGTAPPGSLLLVNGEPNGHASRDGTFAVPAALPVGASELTLAVQHAGQEHTLARTVTVTPRETIQELEASIAAQRQLLADLDGRLAELHQSLTSTARDIDKMAPDKRASAREKIAQIEAELADRQNEGAAIRQRITEATALIAQLRGSAGADPD